MKRTDKKPVKDNKPKLARLINIGAKFEVVMHREMMDRLGIRGLNKLSLIFVGMVR